jgi:CheY-like chemotaxis protein/two-component sensor histidine kinase
VRLVDDLLEVSRISRGALELRKEPVDIASVARNALETSAPNIRAGDHRLTVSMPGEPLWVEADPVRLAQVLANLLNNAAHYTPRGGAIALEAAREGAVAVVRVRDDGAGIAPERLPTIFEMFTRGDGAQARAPKGLGIGLALARGLVEMHGGTIDARSEGPGRGSEFTVRVPLIEPPAHAQRVSDTAAKLAGRRILVIDDNLDAAETLALVLKTLGAEVRVADSGFAGLDVYRAYRPEVVLLDIGMPGMDGYEVARRIRADASGSRTSLVALTGWGQDEHRQKAREAGFDHHLVKPAEIPALQALLGSLPQHRTAL